MGLYYLLVNNFAPSFTENTRWVNAGETHGGADRELTGGSSDHELIAAPSGRIGSLPLGRRPWHCPCPEFIDQEYTYTSHVVDCVVSKAGAGFATGVRSLRGSLMGLFLGPHIALEQD